VVAGTSPVLGSAVREGQFQCSATGRWVGIALLSGSKSVEAFDGASSPVFAVNTVGMDPFADKAVGEAGSPLVVPVLRFAGVG